MAKVLGFLIRYFSNYYTLHRSDLAARAAPLDPRLYSILLLTIVGKDNYEIMIYEFTHLMLKVCVKLAALSAEQPDP